MTDKSRTPVILSACRTPIGNFLGGLSGYTAPQLGAIAIREVVKRAGISKPEEIDCIITVDNEDLEAAYKALDCYETYRDTITAAGIRNNLAKECYFEIYQENFKPPLDDLFDKLC